MEKIWKMKFSEHKITIISLAGLALIATLIIMNFFSFAEIKKTYIDQVEENQLIKTQHAAGRMQAHIIQLRDELVTLSQLADAKTIIKQHCRSLQNSTTFTSSLVSLTGATYFVSPEGDVTGCGPSLDEGFVGVNIKNKNYFIIPKKTKKPYISPIIRSGNKNILYVAAPILDYNKYVLSEEDDELFEGLLLASINIEELYNLYAHPYTDSGRSFFILITEDINNNETIVLMQEGIPVEIIPSLPEAPPGTSDIRNIRGLGKSIVTSESILLGKETLKLIMITPLSLVSSKLNSLQTRHIIGFIFTLFLIVLIASAVLWLQRSRTFIKKKLLRAQNILEKYNINISVETNPYTDIDISLEPGRVYLVQKESSENHDHELFIKCLGEGRSGLGIVRENPDSLKSKYNIYNTSFLWMIKIPGKGETDISNIVDIISEFINKSKKSVILIERLDFLIAQNSFEKVLSSIQYLHDIAQKKNTIIILSINPELISKEELLKIKEEAKDVLEKIATDRTTLTPEEKKILWFINDRNTKNMVVTLKDITNQFKITRPTTRTRVRSLIDKGLIRVEQKGRSKVIKITSYGRRLLF